MTNLSLATNWAVNMMVSSTFLSLVQHLGKSSTFLFYSLVTTVCCLILVKWLPETRGVSLEETESLFRQADDGDRSRYSLVSRDDDDE